jgi:hypothetical protein
VLAAVTTADEREGKAALAAAARAFTKAQTKGLVWIGEQGTFETHEAWDMPQYRPSDNPAQLRLA